MRTDAKVRKITYFGCSAEAAAQNQLLWLLQGRIIAVTKVSEREKYGKTAGCYKRRIRESSGNDGFLAVGAAKVGEIAHAFSPSSQRR